MSKKYSHAKTHPPPGSDLPERAIYPLRDQDALFTLEQIKPLEYSSTTPIAIDFGHYHVRAGPVNYADPTVDFPTITSRYRDRKVGKSSIFVGNDSFNEASVRTGIKSPFDGSMITNWDMVEKMLDYTFLHLNFDGPVQNPIVLTEQPCGPLSQRSTWQELMFETYDAPKVAFGVDSLFSFKANSGRNGLVVGTGHESTHIIPVVNGKPIRNVLKRINVGGHQLTDYMRWFLTLKYPYFPVRLNDIQVENLILDHCYVSSNFNNEIKETLNLDYLEKNDITLEAPFNEIITVEKTEEEIKQEENRRRENAKRMQRMAKEKRKEKLKIKQKDYDYYMKMRASMEDMNRKEANATLREAGFDDEEDLDKYLETLEKALKKANVIEGEEDEENNDVASKYDFSILEIPNEELTPEQLKEKRRLRLIKSNIDSKQKAREEKEEAKREAEAAIQRDHEFRETDLEGWVKVKRERLEVVIQKRKERQKLKEELGDRKSKASQMRMKNIASLADDGSGTLGNQLRKRNHGTSIDKDPTDNFGTNDEDWSIYREISAVDFEEASEEEKEEIYNLEVQLLAHDPNFNIEHTQERQFDWKGSTLHKFLRGPREFDAEDQHQLHQIHLNVERIKIPEIMFQPAMAGVDQAGVAEVCEDIVLRRLPQELGFSGDSSQWCEFMTNNNTNVLTNVFLTGGQALFKGFKERMENELTSVLPNSSGLKVQVAKDPLRDSWRGMRAWSLESNDKEWISKQQYEEMGGEYMAENDFNCNQKLIY